MSEGKAKNTPREEKPSSGVAHKAATVLGIALCVLLVPVLIVNCIILFKGATNQGEVPSVGGMVPFIVLSDSMNPEIQSGDLIVCRQADAESIHEGDIISFFDPEGNGITVITHRVAGIESDAAGQLRFTTKGDANNVADAASVSEEKIIGIYQFRIPGLGNVAMFMQSTQGLVVCVAIPVALLLAYDIIRRRSYDKRSKAETDALKAELEQLRGQQAHQAGELGQAVVVAEGAKPADAPDGDEQAGASN